MPVADEQPVEVVALYHALLQPVPQLLTLPHISNLGTPPDLNKLLGGALGQLYNQKPCVFHQQHANVSTTSLSSCLAFYSSANQEVSGMLLCHTRTTVPHKTFRGIVLCYIMNSPQHQQAGDPT